MSSRSPLGNAQLRKLVAGGSMSGNTACAGLLAVALVDVQSGRCLFAASGPNAPDLDLRRAARHHAAVLRSQLEAAIDLELSDEIEDVLMTMKGQYHLIRFVPRAEYAGLFLYLVADRERANLAMARRELRETASALTLAPAEQEMFDQLRQNTGRGNSAFLRSSNNYALSRGDSRGRAGSSAANTTSDSEEELPPFMRTESVMRLLGISAKPETMSVAVAA